MINERKNFNLSEAQRNLLFHVEPWWEKDLAKLIKQQRKWLGGFGQSIENFFSFETYSYDEYLTLIKNINHYLNFYEAKTKEILKLPRAVFKFRKWYVQVENLKALLQGVVGVSEFYETLEIKGVADKRQFLIDKTNNLLLKIYQNYQRDLKQASPKETHETWDQIFKNTPKIENKQIFNPRLVFSLGKKYINRLFKIKKINEETFVNLIFKTASVSIFFGAYTKFQEKLLANFA